MISGGGRADGRTSAALVVPSSCEGTRRWVALSNVERLFAPIAFCYSIFRFALDVDLK